MPTYEYACKDCGEQLEVVQSFRDDPLTECPNCKGSLRKVFSPVGIAFKGSGFYKTDSRSSSSSKKSTEKSDKSEKSEKSEKSAASDSSKSSSDSTSTTKSDTSAKSEKKAEVKAS